MSAKGARSNATARCPASVAETFPWNVSMRPIAVAAASRTQSTHTPRLLVGVGADRILESSARSMRTYHPYKSKSTLSTRTSMLYEAIKTTPFRLSTQAYTLVPRLAHSPCHRQPHISHEQSNRDSKVLQVRPSTLMLPNPVFRRWGSPDWKMEPTKVL